VCVTTTSLFFVSKAGELETPYTTSTTTTARWCIPKGSTVSTRRREARVSAPIFCLRCSRACAPLRQMPSLPRRSRPRSRHGYLSLPGRANPRRCWARHRRANILRTPGEIVIRPGACLRTRRTVPRCSSSASAPTPSRRKHRRAGSSAARSPPTTLSTLDLPLARSTASASAPKSFGPSSPGASSGRRRLHPTTPRPPPRLLTTFLSEQPTGPNPLYHRGGTRLPKRRPPSPGWPPTPLSPPPAAHLRRLVLGAASRHQDVTFRRTKTRHSEASRVLGAESTRPIAANPQSTPPASVAARKSRGGSHKRVWLLWEMSGPRKNRCG